ncbi:hypothetical protein GCM10023194_09660 [Planotetraspora phitsanulokensis]|uniref:DUF308 domain-containing protein n=1 Tax=Planotetraspora phitsanulokensis TaxID=575192 RepID=A0A8J3TYV8_9ACTN|nr:hypothetical protein [Planotetraspora phitsanulokensis]GII35278.1 hypothetical protein Pph01_02810 [Planotetraspora phitsanulokensis]
MTPQSDEDEVWRQIVASFNEKAEDASADQPWPDRENVAVETVHEDGEAPEREDEPRDEADDETDGSAEQADDEGHYVPPPPPPLPRGDALSRLSWVALFGGPAYLLLAALLDWPMEGWIVFTAVAAFIGGFVTLVVRMGDGPPPDSGWDDGAVI